jgi:steroid delta-isomerase-like uncharacterized protein
MSEQENIRIAETWMEAVNAHDVSPLENYRAPGFVVEDPGHPGPVGADEENAFLRAIFEAFPDVHWETRQTVAQGDFVVLNLIMSGTQAGPMTLPDQTLPATGKKMAMPMSNTMQFNNGKVVHASLYYDRLGMLAQLGLMTGM